MQNEVTTQFASAAHIGITTGTVATLVKLHTNDFFTRREDISTKAIREQFKRTGSNRKKRIMKKSPLNPASNASSVVTTSMQGTTAPQDDIARLIEKTLHLTD